MDMSYLPGIITNIFIISFVAMLITLMIPIIIEDITISKLDKECYKTQKNIYCQSIGMELGSIVITPTGLFGGSPYNKDACVSRTSEKIINYEDVNYEICFIS